MADPSFDPARLRLARELREWSQADLARNLGLSGAAISQFESGAAKPSSETAESIRLALGVPAAFLTLPLTDTHEGFFRSLRRTSVAHRRRARATAHIAHDLATAARPGVLPIIDVPRLPVASLDVDRNAVEAVAAEVRRVWKVPRGPIKNVAALLEQHGIVVLRLPLDSADVDAFSLPFGDRPVVVLGADKNDKARSRFDAAHELGHLVLHGEQVWGVKEVEDQAHMFAAAFLMPEADIKSQLPTTPDWQKFFQLKVEWEVSLAALLMRARKLGTLSESQYLSAIKAMSAKGWRRTEPIPLGAPEQPNALGRLIDSGEVAGTVSALPQHVMDVLRNSAA